MSACPTRSSSARCGLAAAAPLVSAISAWLPRLSTPAGAPARASSKPTWIELMKILAISDIVGGVPACTAVLHARLVDMDDGENTGQAREESMQLQLDGASPAVTAAAAAARPSEAEA